MLITYFRSSSFNQFNLCQQLYFLDYVLGIPSGSNKRAEIGTIVHKALECLALAKLSQQKGRKTFDDEHFGRVKVRLDDDDFVWEMVDKSFEHYTHPDNTTHGFTKADYKECRELTEAVLKTPVFDPRKRTIIDAEPHFDFALDDKWAHYAYPNGLEGQLRLKGTIDLVAEIDKNTYEVIDWKTGQRKDWGTGQVKDFYKLSDDPQLRMYHLALHNMYPKVKHFVMSIYWIRDGGPFTLAYGPKDLDKTKEMLRNQFQKIQKTTRPRLKSESGQHWFCRYVCHYGKNAHPECTSGSSICQFLKRQTIQRGMPYVVDNYTKQGFTIDHYENPGA
jgi:hypothetical protein